MCKASAGSEKSAEKSQVYRDLPDWTFKDTQWTRVADKEGFDTATRALSSSCMLQPRVPRILIDTLKIPIALLGWHLHGVKWLIHVSTVFAKYKWYATSQVNVGNHRTRQLPPQKPMIEINISESDSNDVIIVWHAAGRHAICIIRTLYSHCIMILWAKIDGVHTRARKSRCVDINYFYFVECLTLRFRFALYFSSEWNWRIAGYRAAKFIKISITELKRRWR